MTCSDVDRILPDLIDGAPIQSAQDFEFQSHLRNCPDCSELVSDLKLIASESRQFSNTEEPPSRVWVRIAAELRAEGLIRDPELPSARVLVAPQPQPRWSALWFAPVAILLLAAGSYLMHHRTTASFPSDTAKQSAQQPAQQVAPQVAQQQTTSTPAQSPQSTVATPGSAPDAAARLSPPASADDQDFLTEVSQRAPTMRANYENQLQAVNHEIQETQAYIQDHPGDGDARQHLMEVFQQKAMLYQMALDRIQ
jgi:hypothetical protein